MEKEIKNRRRFKKYFKYFKITSFLVILISILYYLFKGTKFIGKIFNVLNKIPLELYIISILFLFIYIIEKYLFYKYINFFTKKYIIITICLANSLCLIFPLYLYLNEIMNKWLFLIFSIKFSISFILYCFVLIAEKINQNNKKLNESEKENKKVYSLWDIYTGNFNNEDLKNLKIEDKDKIEHDLFRRELIIDNLYNSIINSKDKTDCFSIGIVGEWGSGKSTIIALSKNKVLKDKFKEKFIIIDDFDPWVIKSQDAIILAMYNTIIENLGENIGYFKRKKIQNALINITTNIPYIGKGIGNYFENRIDDYTEYKEIKADLEEKLEKSDEKLVFIIDNLDRMNSDNVLFMLTLIGTLFRLPNITYIIAYDKGRMNTIFKSDKINSKYLEKIINKEIVIPRIHNLDKQSIFYHCLKNCINDSVDNTIIKIISSKFDNIREFISFLNFIIFYMSSNYLWINKNDFLIIRTIEFLDKELYIKIYKNKNFITRKKNNKDDFTFEENEFYEEVESSNFLDLLQHLSCGLSNFNIMNYPTHYSSLEGYHYLCDKNSFGNYFSLNTNTEEYIEIKEYFNYTDINYENTTIFFDENKKYLKWGYIMGLNTYLEEIAAIKNVNSIRNNKLSIFLFFFEKLVNGLFYEHINSEKCLYNSYKYIFLKDYEEIDTYHRLENSEYFKLIQNIFIKILKSEDFSESNCFKDIFFNSNKFVMLSYFYIKLTFSLKNDDNITILEKNQYILEQSRN